MAERTYFDWNATAPLRSEAREAIMACDGHDRANASSVHGEGRGGAPSGRGQRAERGRRAGRALLEAKNVTFTSGATEANMLAADVRALEDGGRKSVGATGCSCRRSSTRRCAAAAGFPAEIAVEELPVTGDGLVDLHALRSAIARSERPLVSVMLANNETGVIQPIAAIAAIVHAANGILHVDAVQGAGRIDCSIGELGADLISISAHKLGGPQGVGALIRCGDIHIGEALITGGGQERGLRAGTENVAGHCRLLARPAPAAGAQRQADAIRMTALRDRLESGLKAATPQAVIFGAGGARLPNTTLFAVPRMKAETAIIAFDLNGIAVSSGSACSSGKVQASSVLAAMGADAELTRGALRLSLGWSTTEADVKTC